MKRFSSAFFFLSLLLCAASAHAAPVITSVSPSSASVGTVVTVSGRGFLDAGASQNGTTISLGRFGAIDFVSTLPTPNGQIASDSSLTFLLPSSVATACSSHTAPCQNTPIVSGLYQLSLKNANGASNKIGLTVVPAGILKVIAPKGGETWAIGSKQSIRWSYSHVSDLKSVTLRFIDASGNAVATGSVAPSTTITDPTTGRPVTGATVSKSVIVPALAAGNYSIGIHAVSQNGSAAEVFYDSVSAGTVNISAPVAPAHPVQPPRPTISVVRSPGATFSWAAGTVPALSFTTNVTSGVVSANLVKGSAVYAVASGIPASSGTATLDISQVPAGSYLLRLTLSYNSNPYVSPSVAVTIKAAPGTAPAPRPAPTVIHALPVSNSTAIDGSVDNISCKVISGWACDGGANPITVQAYDETGHFVGSHLASLSRPDVTASGRCAPTASKDTKFGFSFAFPSWDKDGKPHTISLYGIEYGSAGKMRGILTPLATLPGSISCSFGAN